MTGKFINFEKNLAFNFALEEKVLPVSLGLLMLSVFGEIFFYSFRY